jgi:SAM-dependent methyltransferase
MLLLSHGWAYDLLQYALGGARTRRWIQQEFIRARAGERVLDVGCGTADVLSVLPDVEYIGFDISEAYVARARSRWGSRGRFYAQQLDRDAMMSLGAFDLVLATGVLHHLGDHELTTLFELLPSALTRAGRIVTVDPCFVDKQNPIARSLIKNDRGKYVRSPQAYVALATSSGLDVRGSLIHRKWFPYTYWIMQINKR